MADQTTVSVLLKLRDEMSRGLQQAEGKMRGFANQVQKHQRAIGMAATATGAAITGVAVASIKAAMDEQIGLNELDNALRRVGTSYESNKVQIEALVEAQQRKTNFGDDASREALTKLITISGDYERSLKHLTTAEDLAAGMKMDLGAAAVLVGKALVGETSSLSRYGVILEEGMSNTEQMVAIQQKFAGAAEAAVNPITQLKNRIGDLFEAIGESLVPHTDAFLKSAERAIAAAIAWIERNPELTASLVKVAAAIGGILLVAGPLILMGAAVSLAWSPVSLTLMALVAVIALVVVAMANWEGITNDFMTAVNFLHNSLLGWELALHKVNRAIQSMIPGMKNRKKQIEEDIKATTNAIKTNRAEMSHYQDAIREKKRSNQELMQSMKDTALEAKNMAVTQIDSMANAESMIEDINNNIGISHKGLTEVVANEISIQSGIHEGWTEKQHLLAQERKRMAAEEAEVERIKTEQLKKEVADRLKSRQEELNEIIRIRQQEEQGRDRSLDQLRSNLDETNIAWRESGSSMEDVVKKWADATDKSVEDVISHWDRHNIDVNNVKQVLSEFTKATGEDFLAWAGGVKVATEEVQTLLDNVSISSKGVGDSIRDSLGIDARKEKMGINHGDMQYAWGEVNEHFRLQTGAGALGVTQEGIAKQLAGQQTDAKLKEMFQVIADDESEKNAVKAEALVKEQAVVREANLARSNERNKRMVDTQMAKRAANVAMFEDVRDYANGGISHGGIALVGERGPEIVSLPGGSRVHPNNAIGGGATFHFHGPVYGVEDLKRVVVEAVRDHAISGGFSGVFGGE